MKKIPLTTKEKIANKYELDSDIFYNDDVLTKAERNWLANNPIIDIAVPTNSLPYSKVDKKGNIEVMIGDLIDEMEKRLNIDFKFYPNNLPNALEALNTGTIDILSPLAITDKRKEVFAFSESFFITPIAIFSNDHYSYVNNNQLKDLTVITIEKNAIIEFLNNDYSDMEVVTVKDTKQALALLHNGEKAVFIGDMINANNIIYENHFDNVRVIGYTNYNYNMAFAMNHDNLILQSILDKTLKSIFAEKGDSIQQQWLITDHKVDITKYIVAIIISAIIITLMYFQLRKSIKNIKENEIHLQLIDNEILFVDIDLNCLVVHISKALSELLNINTINYIGCEVRNIFYDFDESKLKESQKSILKLTSNNFIPFSENKENICLEYEIFENDIGDDGYKLVFNDITSHMLYEAKLKAETDSIAKSEFLAIISHEIRTPLTTVLGITNLLNKNVLNLKQKDYIGKIYSASTSLLNIVNDMLDITKFESGKLDVEFLPFNFNEVMENIITMNKMKVNTAGNEFYYYIDENIPNNLVGDALRLGQILNNLLSNANKFTHKGKVSISINFAGKSLNDIDLKFIIRDTGIGMSPEQIARLYNPFEQTNTSIARRYGGTGLGMSISKQLIDLMGGVIKVDSKQGEGTIFILYLNFIINKQEKNITEQSYDKEISHDLLNDIKGKKILIVEDHIINQEILIDILSFYELNIDTANNGIEALKKVNNNNYDLILMDIQMPKMDGLTATRKIREMKDINKNNIPILAMTAHALQEEFQNSIDAGMNDHLTKPIDIKLLENALLKYLTNNIRTNNITDDNSTKVIIDNKTIETHQMCLRS